MGWIGAAVMTWLITCACTALVLLVWYAGPHTVSIGLGITFGPVVVGLWALTYSAWKDRY